MFLNSFYSTDGVSLRISGSQGSRFAKGICDDFNPIHNHDDHVIGVHVIMKSIQRHAAIVGIGSASIVRHVIMTQRAPGEPIDVVVVALRGVCACQSFRDGVFCFLSQLSVVTN